MAMCYFELGFEETAPAFMARPMAGAALPPTKGELPALSEGAIMDQWVREGILETALKGLSYYYLYSRRWGHRAAIKKILRHFLRRWHAS